MGAAMVRRCAEAMATRTTRRCWRGYRRCVVKVHPDKLVGKDALTQARGAELFKIITGKHEEWKRRRGIK